MLKKISETLVLGYGCERSDGTRKTNKQTTN